MKLPIRHLASLLLLCLSLMSAACQEKDSQRQTPESAMPAVANPGMRAYVDPVTGEYAPAPHAPTTEPTPLVPGAAITTPVAKPPVEVPLPQGGVMIELGDQFRAEGQAAE